jgi:hypothetical protein
MADTFVDALGRVVEFPEYLPDYVADIFNKHEFEIIDLTDFGSEGWIIVVWDEGYWYNFKDLNDVQETYVRWWNLSLEDAAEHGAYPLDY